MTVRIAALTGQITFVTIAFVVVTMASLVVGLLAGAALGGLLGTFLTVVAVVLSARWFRSGDEPRQKPRLWWRMTYSSTASFVWSVLFAIGGVMNLIAGSAGVVAGVISFIIAIAYLNSAVRTRSLPYGIDLP